MTAFVLAILWFIFFGLALLYRGLSLSLFGSVQFQLHRIRFILLVVFTCGAGTGCILLSIGQHGVHSQVNSAMSFVVNQSEFTVNILRNVTGFVSLAKTINVDQIILPSLIQNKIDKLNNELKNAADTLSDTTSENSARIKNVLDQMYIYHISYIHTPHLIITALNIPQLHLQTMHIIIDRGFDVLSYHGGIRYVYSLQFTLENKIV